MQQAIRRYRVREVNGTNEKIILSDSGVKEFMSELKDGEEFVQILQKGLKLKTHKQRRYLHGGVLKAFVPNHFESVADAKDHFCRLYLLEEDVFDVDEIEELRKAMGEAREILSYKTLPDNNRIAVKWVKSTEALSTRETAVFIDKIIRIASKNNIHIKTPEEFYEQN